MIIQALAKLNTLFKLHAGWKHSALTINNKQRQHNKNQHQKRYFGSEETVSTKNGQDLSHIRLDVVYLLRLGYWLQIQKNESILQNEKRIYILQTIDRKSVSK